MYPPSSVFLEPQGSTYETRRDALIDYFATRTPGDYYPRIGFIEVAARLHRKAPLESILPHLDPLLDQPHGDMFWMYPMVLVHYAGRDRLPADVLRRMRALWHAYTPYRGDTENHWLLYYASLYLVCTLYPADPAEIWFNGRSARENIEEAEAYIRHWVDLTTSIGQGEYDSPHYLPFYLAPLALLYGYAEAPPMRRLAAMMLDYLIADFAVDTLNGLYAGAFSRIYPEPALERARNGSTSFAWLLFGNVPFKPDPVNVVLPRVGYRPHGTAAILAMSGYTPSPLLEAVARDRDTPFIHRERKRTRHRIRYGDVRNAPVYKYTSMRREYALGSTQGGLLQPVQQHTWELMWATADPYEGFNVLFTLHPCVSEQEVGMYFPEEPKLLIETVSLHEKRTYGSPDKWTGASPYEQVVQHHDTLVALYDLPTGVRFPHIDTYVSRTLRAVEVHPSGWLFARGGDALIALYPLAPGSWHAEPGGDRRLRSPHPKNGIVLQVAPAADFPSFEAFKARLLALPLETQTAPVPTVTFTTLTGDRLHAAYGDVPRLNDTPIDYAGWPLFDGPFLHAETGSRTLTIRHGDRRRVLDFNTFTIEDAPT